ncbi:MAG: hypothetical protein WC483_07145, partial [Candidatus Paceibacterota bacterium]
MFKTKRILWVGLISLILLAGLFNISKAESCPFNRELVLGTEHEQVGILQTFMKNTIKIYDGPITNYFGPLTMSA